jgi:hypothetical protein
LENRFNADEIAAARLAQEELAAGDTNRAPAFSWPAPKARKNRSWKMPYATLFRSELAELARSPRLLEAIAREFGARSIRFWFDQLLWESPAPPKRPVNFETNASVRSCGSSRKNLKGNWRGTCDLPLTHPRIVRFA